MSIMTQLEFQLDFSNSEKNLAKYILDNGEKVLMMSIKKLAKETYSSPATIVRFCNKLGLEGYSDFKIKYSAELQFDKTCMNRVDVNYPFTKEDSKQQIIYKLATLQQETIEDTIKLINLETLEKAVSVINNANRIFLFGTSNSAIVGLDFQHKMTRIGKLVELKTLPGEQLFLAYNSEPTDVAILISYTGETSDVIDVASILKNRGTPMIGITSVGENQLSNLCDYILNTGSREKIFDKISHFASRTSMQYILDILFSFVFQLKYDENIKRKIGYDKEYDHRHPRKSPINIE